MSETTITDSGLLDVLARLEPSKDPNESLRKVLIDKARQDLVRYRLMADHFERQYGQSFPEFKREVTAKHPSLDVEQDFFDWEMSVTMIEEMEEALTKLLDNGA